jgi:hypothetical protein
MMNNIFSPLLQNGISSDVVYFLLLIPFIVMVATFARHVIGIKIFSMFVFVAMTFVAGFLLRRYSVLSIVTGVGVLIFIYFFSYFIKRFTNTLSLHYFSRISMVVTMISILLLGILTIVGRYENVVRYLELDKITPFTLVFAVLLSEYFSSNQTQKGFKTSRALFAYSTFLAIVIGLLISWNTFEWFMFKYPVVIFIFMLFTIMIGKYKGLRITEVGRFREVDLEERKAD